MMNRNILITGGSGRLGRFVADELRNDGYRVTLFDLYAPDVNRYPWETDHRFVQGDITSLADNMRAITLAESDTIIHLGAIPSSSDLQPGNVGIQRRPEDLTMRTNVMGTYYLMDAARRLGVKKVIFASSFYMLGLGFRITDKPFQVDYLPIDEKHPNRPEDTYSLSKLLGEEIIETYCRAYGIKGVSLRLLGVSFPFLEHEYDIQIAESPNYVGGPVGDTHQYVDCRDIANVCKLALEKDLDSDFEAFFVLTDNKFAGKIRDVIERAYPDLREMAKNLGDDDGIITDKKLRDTYGYTPQYSWKSRK
jgi:nucleoside-diphosphate-sugar epimerase